MSHESLPPSESLVPDGFFHFEEDRRSFEDLAYENGTRRWSARQLMELLGYSSWSTFKDVINRAATACMSIGATTLEHFHESADPPDYRLTKFACYLVAMNGDPRKPGVAKAQVYFATLADAFQQYIESAEDVERVEVRHRVSTHEKSLNSTAKRHGVDPRGYAFFADQGYRGLYNMSLNELRQHKGDPSKGKRPLLDFMGRRELAANLFRLTETEARIENEQLHGQKQLESAAFTVGRAVRTTMIATGGPAPESLPLKADIKKVEGDLRRTAKGLGKPSAPKLPAPAEDAGDGGE